MKQITEDYVSYEIAVLLKEKGFKEIVQSLWVGADEYHYISTELIKPDDYNSGGTCLYSAPTHQMALKWLREVHRIETHIVLSELNTDNSRKYMFDIYSSDINRDFDSVQKEGFNSYEQAVEAAILYVLKNLI